MDLMARYEDNYFDLAIVDPPYGIEVNMNAGRRKGDKKDIKIKIGIIVSHQWNILKSCREFPKIKLFGVQIILMGCFGQVVEYHGLKTVEQIMIILIVN